MDYPVAEVWRIERRMRTSNRQARPIPLWASMNPMTIDAARGRDRIGARLTTDRKAHPPFFPDWF